MILGYTFLGDKTSFSSTAISVNNLETITVKNSVVNELYVTSKVGDVDNFNGIIPTDWDIDTRLHALFNDDLYGGNVDFTEEIVSSVRIKRKTAKDKDFKTIFEKEINSKEDFSISLIHYYAPVGNVSFAYVPIISGGEGEYIINTVESNFDSYFICEKDVSYPMILDTSFDKKLVQRTAIIEPMGREKPIIVRGGLTKYYTGDIECCFIECDDSGDWNIDTSWEYRNTIYDMLTNGNIKIIKDFFGNVWMMAVSSNEITESSDHYKHVITKFSVTECGDAYSINDLYYNGFIDVNIDG